MASSASEPSCENESQQISELEEKIISLQQEISDLKEKHLEEMDMEKVKMRLSGQKSKTISSLVRIFVNFQRFWADLCINIMDTIFVRQKYS